jgi:hypothetical protein
MALRVRVRVCTRARDRVLCPANAGVRVRCPVSMFVITINELLKYEKRKQI